MKKTYIRLLSLLLAMIMVAPCLCIPAFTADSTRTEGEYTVTSTRVDTPENYTFHRVFEVYKNGTKIWELTSPDSPYTEVSYVSEAYINNGNVYIAINNSLHAYDVETGNLKWTVASVGYPNAFAFDQYNNIYVGGYDTIGLTVVDKNGTVVSILNGEYNWVYSLDLNQATGILHIYYDNGHDGVAMDSLYISQFAPISVFIDGKYMETDQNPFIENDRTLVPMRAIFESLGASVEWKGDTKEVIATKGDKTIRLTIDSNEMYVNDNLVWLDAPAKIANDRTMVPARAVAEALDCEVGWNGQTRSVYITSSNKNKVNDELLSYRGKTKAENESKLGGLVASSFIEGGKFYEHEKSKAMMFYLKESNYDYLIIDDCDPSSICLVAKVPLSELINNAPKTEYTADELVGILGNYEYEFYADELIGEIHSYTFKYKNYLLRIECEQKNSPVTYIDVYADYEI